MNKAAFRAALLAVPYLLAVPALVHAGETGEALFASICAACHGDKGQGTEGIAPPLVDPVLWQGLGDKAPVYIAGVLAGGLSGQLPPYCLDSIDLLFPTQPAPAADDLTPISAFVMPELYRHPPSPANHPLVDSRDTPTLPKAPRPLRQVA